MSVGMSDIAVADELAIRRTLAACCQHLDDGDFSAVAEQFTPDGSISFGDRGGASGRAGIEAWYAERNPPERRGRHLTVNTIVDLDGDRATAWSDFTFLGFVDGDLRPLFAGRYHDEFARAEGRWLIARRVAVLLAPA
jgi:3-phenylpropionate/cinnamic acid dioxygenase small subunit